MTLTMAAHITFPAAHGRSEFDIRRVSSVRIESSWKDFADKAEITLPRNVKNINAFQYRDIFRNGDPVIVRLGYGSGELPVEFEGYIYDVTEGVPITLRCENEMYKLKRGNVSVSSAAITLKDLLLKIAPSYEIVCDDVKLGAVRYANVAPIRVLEDIKKETGLHAYFSEKKLHCGIIYAAKSDVLPVKISLEKQAISESLTQKNTSEEVLIKAISILSNGKKITAEVGSKGGTSVQRTYINVTAKIELEKQAKRDLEKYKKKGCEGSISVLGMPSLKHGMKVDLHSVLYPNMNGVFYIEKVVKTFGEGYHQELTLGDRADG